MHVRIVLFGRGLRCGVPATLQKTFFGFSLFLYINAVRSRTVAISPCFTPLLNGISIYPPDILECYLLSRDDQELKSVPVSLDLPGGTHMDMMGWRQYVRQLKGCR